MQKKWDDFDQRQGSSHADHKFMVPIICMNRMILEHECLSRTT